MIARGTGWDFARSQRIPRRVDDAVDVALNGATREIDSAASAIARGNTPSLSLAGIAARTGLSRAAARRLVLTLEHLGYVKSQGRGDALSPRVLELGLGYVGSLKLSDLVQPHIEALAQRIPPQLLARGARRPSIVYVLRVPVQRLMTVSLGVGSRLPAYCASLGRVLVSGLSDADLRTWLEQCQLVRQTSHTVTDVRRLRRLVETVRKDGYAYVEQELELGLCSMAVPVPSP